MKELERLLYSTPKPEVKTTAFRQNLRRSLLNSSRYLNKSFKGRTLLFLAPSALAAVLAVLVATFVINPTIPFNFHKSITTGGMSLDSGQVEPQLTGRPRAILNGSLFHLIEQLQQATEEDLDKAFVRFIAQEHHQFEPDVIQSVGRTKLLAITQYQLNNGQTVLVYTQLPDDQIRFLRAY